MLVDLRIENLALVESARVSFTPGLNVISGETGAGKTLLVQALSLISGGRANTDLIRLGSEAALIEARYELNGSQLQKVNEALLEAGLPDNDDVLVVRRRITREGKSRVYINDASATLSALQSLTFDLVELTGQHEQFGLLRTDRHLVVLDAFAQLEEERGEVAKAVRDMRSRETDLLELQERQKNRTERAEFLRFYLEEFSALKPEPGEEERLLERLRLLRNVERLKRGVLAANNALYEGNPSAYDLVAEARRNLSELTPIDPRLEEPRGLLEQILELMDQAHRQLTRHADDDYEDPEETEALEARLHNIQRLCRKHSLTLTELMAKMCDAEEELQKLAMLDDLVEEARRERDQARERALKLARSLSLKRRESAPELEKATAQQLRDLGFAHARFQVMVESTSSAEELTEAGSDQVSFLLSTNPGQPAKPLAKVASGGELSRILLALKCALARADAVPVHVFDEIDTGIGGGAAEIVGRKIRHLANGAQVLCVTHLPQIACFADTHLAVRKVTDQSETRTVLVNLASAEREEEVARMLGGAEITQTTREHAREMLERSRLATQGVHS